MGVLILRYAVRRDGVDGVVGDVEVLRLLIDSSSELVAAADGGVEDVGVDLGANEIAFCVITMRKATRK